MTRRLSMESVSQTVQHAPAGADRVGNVKRLFAAGVTAICATFILPANAAEVPDGRIAFTGHDSATDSDELYSTLPDGSDRVNLTRRFGADARPPVYSPDGRWIAFGCTK